MKARSRPQSRLEPVRHGAWAPPARKGLSYVQVTFLVLIASISVLSFIWEGKFFGSTGAGPEKLTKCNEKAVVRPLKLDRPYSTDRGSYLIGRGLYQMDEHPLSVFCSESERDAVLEWIAAPATACVTELVAAQVPKGNKKQLLVVHTSLEDDHLSVLLNQAVSLHRVGVEVEDVLLIVYDYDPISATAMEILEQYGFRYISAWDFDVPEGLAQESRLSSLEFFFVRDAIILKLLKMGYRVLQVDADVVFLNKNPWSGFDPDLYSIEAAPEGSPSLIRSKWGYTLNCGYMCISPDTATVKIYEKFLVFAFDFVVPIDQWAFNYFLDGSGAVFQSHLAPEGQLINLPDDHGPLVGNITFGGNTILIRALEPRSYLTGRWLNYAAKSKLPLHQFAADNFKDIRCVHPTHMQQGLHNKINWLRESRLWFLRDDWKELRSEKGPGSVGILDTKGHVLEW